MKTNTRLFLLCISIIICSCQSRNLNKEFDPSPTIDQTHALDLSVVPYGMHPITPSQKQLEEVSRINYDSLTMSNGRVLYKSLIFNGWSYQIFENNPHRFRYTKYIKGEKVWQIGYFENGNLDHDFHVYKGSNKGSQRMWREDKTPYIDNYFAEGGMLHGIQRIWSEKNILISESKYEYGILVYEKHFDKNGIQFKPQ